jgi:hypothetical protein
MGIPGKGKTSVLPRFWRHRRMGHRHGLQDGQRLDGQRTAHARGREHLGLPDAPGACACGCACGSLRLRAGGLDKAPSVVGTLVYLAGEVLRQGTIDVLAVGG